MSLVIPQEDLFCFEF